jgi:hypothetical protein
VLITADALLREAVEKRIAGLINVSVLADIDELKGLINTLVSDVTEDFIASLKPKAGKMFFISKDQSTLYYKAKVREQLSDKLPKELAGKPESATFRTDGTWYISAPNFARKEGRRIFWSSRLEIDVEAGVATMEEPKGIVPYGGPAPSYGNANTLGSYDPRGLLQSGGYSNLASAASYAGADSLASVPEALRNLDWSWLAGTRGVLSSKRVVTHKGRDIYEILWSAEVNMAKDLKKEKIEEIRHIELAFLPST